MKNNKKQSHGSNGNVPEKKMWMRIAVLAVCCIMILGFVILPLL
ncbi:MAG: hypothetical protein PUA51_04410 [Oscillospiraceae bacterium]|nr:hypothetical protein [Oscillospiraceae bacterium]